MDLLKTLNNELSHPKKEVGQVWATMHTAMEFLITDIIDEKTVRATLLMKKVDVDYYPNVLLSADKYDFLPSDRIAIGKTDGPIDVNALSFYMGKVDKEDVNEVRASYYSSIEDNPEFKPIVVNFIMRLNHLRMESINHLFY